jgi:hypothetical protein
MGLAFPIIMLILCSVGLIAMYKMSSTSKSKKNTTKNRADDVPVQEFMNVKDIDDMFLYSRDGYLLSYIRIHPFSSDLLSRNEKKALTEKLTEEISETDFYGFKFLAIIRPVDISPVISDYANKITNSDDLIQKDILRQETRVVSEFSLSGDVVQREFFYVLWERYGDSAEVDLKKRTIDFASKFTNAGMKCDILKKHEIIRLSNLVNNPAFAVLEDTDIYAAIPLFVN